MTDGNDHSISYRQKNIFDEWFTIARAVEICARNFINATNDNQRRFNPYQISMKITIIGSSTFKQEMLDYGEKLEKLGHEAIVHPDYAAFVRGEKQDTRNQIQGGEHAKAKIANDYIRRYHNAITNSDAVLALNFEKK